MYVPDKRKEGHGASRVGRQFQILTLLQERSFADSSNQWMSSTAIARAIGLAPSLHVRGMLYDLWEQGCIEFRSDTTACGINKGMWRFKESAYDVEQWWQAWQAWQPQGQMTLQAVR